MEYKIIPLSKKDWEGFLLPMKYTTNQHYELLVEEQTDGYVVSMIKKALEAPITKSPEEMDYPDRLFAKHWEKAYAWGVVQEGQLLAAIETCPEEWSNRLRITELWVDESLRRQGIGHRLMMLAKEQARRERRRAILLETQSCNAAAISFYQQEGFALIGFDRCCYSNQDIEKKEVRLEFGYFPKKKGRVRREDLIIRQEEPEDWYETEAMTKRAFWNKHVPGCDEHFLVHKLRNDAAYLPDLSRVAVKDGNIIGCIMYSLSQVIDEDQSHEIVTFGPLCVDPEWQGCGVGEILFNETLELVKKAGYPGIIIFGEPDYYPRLGFKTCDHFGITTHDGKNFDAFMGMEVIDGGFTNIKGRFEEAEVFETLSPKEAQEYDQKFPFMEAQHFPDQW